jgi:hypothetical protein
MFHGCVSYAVDSSRRLWAGGKGIDAAEARADALRKLGTPAAAVSVQCSDPPGVIK